MPGDHADRNLLFGILALQMDFLTRDTLVAAMNAWVLDKGKALGEILVTQGALAAPDRALLEAMVARHIQIHGGDPEKSLAAVGSVGSAREALGSVADFAVQASMAHVGAARERGEDDPDRTATYVGDSTSAGTRFHILRLHDKGGLGEVFVARDEELHREVALKQIKDEHADDAQRRARFVVEAEITGALEHPGIVPVYGLGQYDNGRPFYAMRFIRGDNLKSAIAQFHQAEGSRRDSGERVLEMRRLLGRFLDVCNAMEYAHSRGVLHRDLKPGNIMLGKYGETLVVDWGLAKSVGRPDVAVQDAERMLQPESGSEVRSTEMGARVGTPAYMSPEQAAGRLDALGPASDVYSLGATLYCLVTGKPPFDDRDLPELLRKIERGEFLAPRTVNPLVDRALDAICRRALALRPEDRYTTPRLLADDIEHWLADEPVTAYREPFIRRARRWARKHRTALATAASAALVAGLLFGGFAWVRIAHRQETDTAGRGILGKAEGLAIEARTSGDLPRWDKAIAEARLARVRLESGGSLALCLEADSRLEAFRAEQVRLQEILAAEKKDRKVVQDLEEARFQGTNVKDGHYDFHAKFETYVAAFRAYGIDLATLSAEDAAARVRSSKVGADLIAALDDVGTYGSTTIPAERLAAIARAAETDPVRASIRDGVVGRDTAALLRLCKSEEDRRRLGPRLRHLFKSLLELDPAGSFPLLATIVRENPSDFWLNHDLGIAFQKANPQLAEAAHYLSVAVALRPDSSGAHINLGSALEAQGKTELAAAEYREAVRIKPDYAEAHVNLGIAFARQGKTELAAAEYREAVRIKPDFAEAHLGLGSALEAQGKAELAAAEYREAVRIKPDYAEAHFNLGCALQVQGKAELAAAEYREAVRIKPDYAEAHVNLGIALARQGKAELAAAEYREAVRIKPDYAEAHVNLGIALEAQGKAELAAAEYREAVRIKPDYAEAHVNLGIAFARQGKIELAAAEYREAVRIKPDLAEAHTNLGLALARQGKADLAFAAYREAIRLEPDNAETICNLGLLLRDQGRFREALEHLERGHSLGSRRTDWPYPSERWVRDVRGLVALEPKLPALLKGEATPNDAGERLALADFCYKTGRHTASARFWEEAFTEQPTLLNDLENGHRYNAACAAALAGSGSGKDEPPPDEGARGKLREKALGWLKADLAAWGKVLDGGIEPARKRAVATTLARWTEDADLAGIHDEGALAKLPEAERDGFLALWSEVDRLLAKARAGAGAP